MYANLQVPTTPRAYICPGCQQSRLLPRGPGDQLAVCPSCQRTFNLAHPAQFLPVQFRPHGGYPLPLQQQQALGPQRPWTSQQALALQQAIAVRNAIAQQQLSPATIRQQEALYQPEMRQMIGLMCQQQQVLLQRVNSLEQWQSQVVAQMSSGGMPGAKSNHSGESQTECQQHIPAIQSAQHDTVSDVAQTDHVVHVPLASQAQHQGEHNQFSQRVSHRRVSNSSQSNHVPASCQGHKQESQNRVSEQIHHQEGQQLFLE